MPTAQTISQTAPTASAATPFETTEGPHWVEKLADDTPVLVRPLRNEDREREEKFINRLSPESRHFRFLDTFRKASPALMKQMMDVSNLRHVAFIALAHDSGELREVGISRYSATDIDKQCECAVTVADDWQRRGLGTLLMRHLIKQAHNNGFTQMVSMDASDNQAMHALAHDLGFQRRRDPDDARQEIHSLDLSADATGEY